MSFPIEGYGANVTGGAGQPTVLVTNLNDSGTGSLRAALHSTTGTLGDRIVRFAAGLSGNIIFASSLVISGRNITWDGADAPGVTIGHPFETLVANRTCRGIIVQGRNIIFRALRVRKLFIDQPFITHDGFGMTGGSEGLVFDRCSISEPADECFSINPEVDGFWKTTASQYGLPLGSGGHATIQYCIFGPTNIGTTSDEGGAGGSGGLLMKLGGARNLTIRRNIFYHSEGRMPRLTVGGITDFSNNIIARWLSGPRPSGFNSVGATTLRTIPCPVNSVDNYFAGPNPGASPNNGWNSDENGGGSEGNTVFQLLDCFESGTTRWDGGTFPTVGVKATPHAAPSVLTQHAITAARRTLALAGHPVRDEVDEGVIRWIRAQDPRLAAEAHCGMGVGSRYELVG